MGKLFEEYFEEEIHEYERLNHNYLGITRKDHPKWQGWKIINQYKEIGICANEINDKALDIHVKNFYYVKYLTQ